MRALTAGLFILLLAAPAARGGRIGDAHGRLGQHQRRRHHDRRESRRPAARPAGGAGCGV